MTPSKPETEDNAGGDGLPMPRRVLAIIAICLGTTVSVIDGHIVTVALPTMARDLRVDGSASVLIVTVYQLTLLMMLLPCSALGDWIGLKKLYQYGQTLFIVATIFCFFADSLPFLLAIRVIQGLGAAASLSVMVALIRNIYPARRIGQGLGVNAVVVSISAAAAPSVGGLILAVAPWPWLFALAVPFALLSLMLGRSALPDIPPAKERYDLGGAVLNMATFGLIFGGMESIVHGGSPWASTAIMATGVLVAFWFVRHEARQAKPILPVDLLGNISISLSAMGALLSTAGSMLLVLSLPFRLEKLYGFSPGEVGAIITPYPAVMMVVAPLGGMLSDRVNPGLLGTIGMAITTAGLLLLAFPPAAPGYFDFAWRMALGGIGSALFVAPNSRLIVSATPPRRTSAAGGLIQTTRNTGQTMGATLLALLLALGMGSNVAPGLVAAALTFVAGLCSAALLVRHALRLGGGDRRSLQGE